MQITTTAKVQVKVLPKERDVLDATLDAYRNACNFVSNYIFRTHNLTQSSLNKALYYKLREQFGLKSQMAQSVFKTVIARYKTILTNQKKWIRPDFKKPQYDLVWNRDYSLNQKIFSVNTLSGRVKLSYFSGGMEKYFDHEKYTFGTAKLVKKHGKYFLHIPVTTEIKESLDSDICNVVGIDRGINFVVATYDSQHINHCISKALVESNPKHTLFVLEDLTGIRSATERVRRKDRYVSVSWSFYDLEQKLKYKAALNESSVINVDPRYTSQTCPVCGHTEKSNRDKKHHIFCCKNCGYTSNDDRIGAMNLYRMGINYLAKDN